MRRKLLQFQSLLAQHARRGIPKPRPQLQPHHHRILQTSTPPRLRHSHPPPRRLTSYGIASPGAPLPPSSRGARPPSMRQRGPPLPGGWPPPAAPAPSTSSRCSGDRRTRDRGGNSRRPPFSKSRPGEVKVGVMLLGNCFGCFVILGFWCLPKGVLDAVPRRDGVDTRQRECGRLHALACG